MLTIRKSKFNYHAIKRSVLCHHIGEWITGPMCMYVAYRLATEDKTNSVVSFSTIIVILTNETCM